VTGVRGENNGRCFTAHRVDLPAAAHLLGIGRTKAHELVRDNRWPTPIIRLGKLIKVPTRPLLDLLDGHVGPRPELLDCAWCGHVFRPRRTGRHRRSRSRRPRADWIGRPASSSNGISTRSSYTADRR
jgi:hypothetical protein